MDIVDLLANNQTLSTAVLNLWKAAHARFPRLTIAATICAALAAVAAFIAAMYQDQIERSRRASAVASYEVQLQRLSDADRSLRELGDFVAMQRAQLQSTQHAIAALKAEQTRLEPLVKANRVTVDALFAAQEARNANAQRRERWIGFGRGILTSLLASLLWYGASRLARRKRKGPTPSVTS